MAAASVWAQAEKEPAPSPLYNEKDLSGWECTDGELSAWQAEGPLLVCTKEGGGWLRTKKTYSDFRLFLEFRIPAGGNSGVGLRLPKQGQPHLDGMEIQILDDDADIYKDLKPAQYCGSVYGQVPAKRGVAKPAGEWNKYEITCAGQTVKVVLNGTVVSEVTLDEHESIDEKLKPLSARAPLGAIGLQSHGSRVEFRNIHIQDLVQATDSGLQFYDLKAGDGDIVRASDSVRVHYTGWLTDGKKFDSSRDRGESISFPLRGVIRGWTEGLTGMKVGGRRKLIIPPDLGYGARGTPGGPIPPNATLVFDVEVLDVE